MPPAKNAKAPWPSVGTAAGCPTLANCTTVLAVLLVKSASVSEVAATVVKVIGVLDVGVKVVTQLI